MHVVTDPHLGETALRAIRGILQLDDRHTLPHDDGFSWWHDDVPVRFRWRAPAGSGLPVWRLSAEVDVATGVDAAAPVTRAYLMLAGRIANQYATVVVGDTLRLRALVSAVPPGQASDLLTLGYRAALMVSAAERARDVLVPMLGGTGDGARVVTSVHPEAGRRAEAHASLDTILSAAVQAGEAPSPVDRRPDLSAAALAVRQLACGVVAGGTTRPGTADTDGFNVVIETPHATSLLELRLRERNPHVGHGLLTVLRLRFPRGHLHGDGADLARRLNDAEWTAPAPLQVLGSWTAPVEGADVAYSAFHPNLLHHPALARDVALDGVRRVRWAFDHLGYTEPFTPQGPYGALLTGRAERAAVEA
jgi:hypothetical protein